MIRNVVLFGGMAAGKSTLADALCESYGYSAVSLAWNMKSIVESAYGTLDKAAMVEVNRGDRVESVSIRQILQEFGQAAKTVDEDFWLRWFLADCQLFADNSIPVVCDDGRMVREATVLGQQGWLLVFIDTPDELRWERYQRRYGRMPSESEKQHRTEQELKYITYDLTIDGTLPIERQVELVMDAAEAL